MNELEKLQEELKTLKKELEEQKTQMSIKDQIESTKREIQMLKLKNSKTFQTATAIASPIKQIGRGFKKSGQYIWNHGLKDIAEQAGESGRKMYKMDEKKK